MLLTNGNALAGRLAKSASDLRIPLRLSPREGADYAEGEVKAGIVEREAGQARVLAGRGVVLACDGFPDKIARWKALFPLYESLETWAAELMLHCRMLRRGYPFRYDAQGRLKGRDAALH
jgi:hypothetical protein